MIDLPFDEAWPQIAASLKQHQNLVIVAEPGAGKTTRLPPGLISKNIVRGKILVLEPRRIAARAAAMRVAEENNWHLPNDVGYAVRFDHRTNNQTLVTYLTEGLFLKRLTQDPSLTDIQTVVLDEFHERSRHTDLAIAALKELQTLERPDLNIIVMSATLDAQAVSQFLDHNNQPAPIVMVPGRSFPVSVHNIQQPLKLVTDREWLDFTKNQIISVAKNLLPPRDSSLVAREDDVLVFLPGTSEIRRMKENLASELTDFEVCELHGSLSLEQQSNVLQKKCGQRRIILATNIAETSLTVEGVGTVIDCGLERVLQTDRLGFSSLSLARITMASAKQRTGRAGRLGPGIAIRLWSKLDELSFRPFTEPEILNVDLTDTVLELAALGIFDPQSFGWFEAPKIEKLQLAIKTLQALSAIDEDRRLTKIGQRMLQSGLPARPARLLVEAETLQPRSNSTLILAATLAALLTERDFLIDRDPRSHGTTECDLYIRYQLLQDENFRYSGRMFDFQARQSILRARESYFNFFDIQSIQYPVGHSQKKVPNKIFSEWDETLVQQLLLSSYPDRLARRRRSGSRQALMVGGKGIELHPSSTLETSDLFFAIRGDAGVSRSSSDPLVTIASPVSVNTLKLLRAQEIRKDTQTHFDESSLSVFGTRATFYRDLAIEDGTREAAPVEVALETLKLELSKRRDRLESLEPVKTFLNRVKFATQGTSFPDPLFTEAYQLALQEFLFGKKSLQDLFSTDGAERFTNTWEQYLLKLNPQLGNTLHRCAPSHFVAPTGNRFRILYPSDQSPYVAIRLQELFGTKENPKIGNINLTFHLLGPNFRPVQVTSDLTGFWKGSYFEVRKELRARYPKHSWPENPLEAMPVAKRR
jgi:ATP-dependent helicase HrpB